MADLSVTSLQNLEDLLSPLYYGNEEGLPCVPPGTPSVPAGLTIQAFLSQDCMWGCVFNGPVIRCFPVQTHSSPNVLVGRGRVPVVINAVAYHFPGSIVKCAAELSIHSHRSSSVNKLLLGLDCGNDGGALVIYDPIRAQPMKWISIPEAVTSLVVLSHFGDESSTHSFFNESMMAMVGVAAVGLCGGKLLIVDLGLDHLDGSPETTKNMYNLNSQNKRWDITYVEPHESFIAQTRRAAALTKKLICLDLKNQDYDESDETYDPDLFYYSDKTGTLIGTYHKQEVFVSCLQYVPNIGSLVVGFNFGGLQIWRVDDNQLEFTTDVGIDEAAVHSVEFQQPIDDPKNFCYLWVLHGTKCAELQHSHAVLYALFFKNRTPSENNSVLYESLESCVGRLTINLQDFYCPEEGLDVSLNSSRFLVRPLRMWNQGENLTCFSWESYRDGVNYIGIFDLNQWYSSQTPSKLECFGQFRLNPFWASISFRNPIDIRKNICSQMWDVRVIPRTMGRWENQFSKHDVHLYPASLTFQAVCLAASGTYMFENFCIQEKLLRLIQKDGYQMMSEPCVLRKLCGEFGLDPMCSLMSDGKMSDQYYVFTVLLENSRPSLIINMANRWVNGSMANLGCNIELILKWISHLTVAVRLLADEHWLNLVRFRRDLLPPDSSQFVIYSNFVWNQLNGILGTLVRHDRVLEDMERDDEIARLQYTLGKLIPYSSALLMMHKARILPVTDDYDVITPLKAICDQRRAEVSHALENCPHLEPELRQGHTLLIDFLMENFDEDFLREEWDVKPGEDIYPPKHPAFIFNMLIGNWIDIDPKIVARVIFYFILDVMNLVGHELLRGDFASLIQLTQAEQQEVVNLWRVDHGEFQDPLTFLSQGGKIDEAEGLPWSAAIVIMIAQGATTPVIDILQRSCPPKLGRLFINLVSDSHQRPEDKLNQIVSSTSFCRDEKLLLHCFDRAYSSGFLDSFIDIHSRHTPLFVQQALISYLEKSSYSYEHQQLLLTFFLRRKDNLRAIEQYERIKNTWFDLRTLSPENRRVWEAREIEINYILAQSSKNNMMEFLGYSAKKSIQRPPPLDVKANKLVPKSPAPNIGSRVKGIPAFKRLLEWEKHMRDGVTPISPLRRYSGRIDKPPPETEMDQTIEEYENAEGDADTSVRKQNDSPDRINVDIILKSPRVDYRKPQEFEDDEFGQTVFQTPCGTPGTSGEIGLHSIMIKSNASLRKRIALKTRFKDIPDSDEEVEIKPLDLNDEGSVSISSDDGCPELGFDTAVELNNEEAMGEVDISPVKIEEEPDSTIVQSHDVEVEDHLFNITDDLGENEIENLSAHNEPEPYSNVQSHDMEVEDHLSNISESNKDDLGENEIENFSAHDEPEPLNVQSDDVEMEGHLLNISESNKDDLCENKIEKFAAHSEPEPNSNVESNIVKDQPLNTCEDSVVPRRPRVPRPRVSKPPEAKPHCTSRSDTDTVMPQGQVDIESNNEDMGEVVDDSPVKIEMESDSIVQSHDVEVDDHLLNKSDHSDLSTTLPEADVDVNPVDLDQAFVSVVSDDSCRDLGLDATAETDKKGMGEIEGSPVKNVLEADSILQPHDIKEEDHALQINKSGDPLVSTSRVSTPPEVKPHDVHSASESDNDSVISQSQMARKKVLKMIRTRRREETPDSDTSHRSGDITSPTTVRRMTRSLSRARNDISLDASMNKSDSDTSLLDSAFLDTKGSKRKTRKKSGSSIADIVESRSKSIETHSGSESDTDSVVSESQMARKKVLQMIKARRRGATPESDTSRVSGDMASPATVRRMTRSASRSKNEGTANMDNSMNKSDSDVSVLEGTFVEAKESKRRTRKKSVPSIAEIVASKDAAKEKSTSTRKRKACSEPRDIRKASSDFSDTSFIDKPRRAVFGFAPGLSTVVEDSESSLLQTPSRNTRSKSLTHSQPRLPKTPSALSKIPEELSQNKPGPSRKSKPVESAPSSVEVDSQRGKRRRRAKSHQPELETSLDEPVKAKRLKQKDTNEEGTEDSDAKSDASSSRRRGPARPRTRTRSGTTL